MAAAKLSAQDKKQLDTFTKHLVYKCIQVIVQSRLGEKVRTQSKPFSTGSESDWFNLALKDLPEVSAETKKVFPGSTLGIGQYVCVEMSLQTPENETMVLETWNIGMTEVCDPRARVLTTVYNRMGTLLKSLVCASRATPSYRLSRQQGSESFIICYRLYMGEPQVENLGEGYQTVKVGSVVTPLGTAHIGLLYRTKLLISPQPCSHDLAINLKDNHFTPEGTGCCTTSPRCSNTAKPCQNLIHPTRFGTTAGALDDGSSEHEACMVTFYTGSSPDGGGSASPSTTTTPSPRSPHRRTLEDISGHTSESQVERTNSFPSLPKVGAFAQLPDICSHHQQEGDFDDLPFLALIQQPESEATSTSKEEEGGVSDASMETQERTSLRSTGSGSGHSSCSRASVPDDFVMVELKTPFAAQDANSDLGRFYRDFQGAPGLSMFNEQSSVEDTLNTITDQLALFEACSKDFDDFVESLPASEN